MVIEICPGDPYNFDHMHLGNFSTAIGTFALRWTSAGRMGAMLYLIPPIATLLGWALLREAPAWLVVLGGVYVARHD